MKKSSVTIGKYILAVSCAIGAACLGIIDEWNDTAILAAFVFVGIMVCLKLGLFDIEDKPKDKHLSTKHGAQSMRPAA